jgi:hypothetical protein
VAQKTWKVLSTNLEYAALQVLADEVKAKLIPLIQVPPIPRNWETDAPSKTLADHLQPVASAIHASWGHTFPMFVDLIFLDETPIDGAHPVAHTFDQMRKYNLLSMPVTGLGRSDQYQEAVREVVAQEGAMHLCGGVMEMTI